MSNPSGDQPNSNSFELEDFSQDMDTANDSAEVSVNNSQEGTLSGWIGQSSSTSNDASPVPAPVAAPATLNFIEGEDAASVTAAADLDNPDVASTSAAQPNTTVGETISDENPTLTDLLLPDAGDITSMSFEMFIDGLLRVANEYLDRPQAIHWRSRIVQLSMLTLENSPEDEFDQESLIRQLIIYLVQELSETDPGGVDEQVTQNLDNMTHEELINLQESLGNVNTGLSLELILTNLKTYEYQTKKVTSPDEIDRCCICLEDYIDGTKVGKLNNCVHEFHFDCIKQWLMRKDFCPLCRSIVGSTNE